MGNSRGPVVPLAIEDLAEFPPEMVRTALNAEFSNPNNTSSQRLAVAYALATFGQVEGQFLLEAIPTAPSEEVDNLAAALAHDREAALQDLQNAAATATSKQDWKLKTRLATVALYLDRPVDRGGNAASRATSHRR